MDSLDAGLSKPGFFATLIRPQPTADRGTLVFARALRSQVQALVRAAERCSTLGCEPKGGEFFIGRVGPSGRRALVQKEPRAAADRRKLSKRTAAVAGR